MPDLSILPKTLYFWVSYVVQFVIPFILLLIRSMNSTIIHVLRTRSILQAEHKGRGQDQGQKTKIRSSEKQITAILLLVAFSFFILITLFYAFIVYLYGCRLH